MRAVDLEGLMMKLEGRSWIGEEPLGWGESDPRRGK